MAAGEFLLALVVLALFVLGLFLFYSFLHRTFRRVGFTPGEASLILFGTLLGGWINIPIWPEPVGGGWILAVNVGGAVVPVLVSFWLLHRIRSMALQAIVGVVLVSLVTYLVTSARPEGIAVPLYLAPLPALTAAGISLTSYWRDEDHAAPLAYVSGTFGALVGADVLRLGEFLAQTPPEPGAVASIGGAAVFDMVYLTGIVAVAMDALVFRRRTSEREHGALPYTEAEVFTVSTPPERFTAWRLEEFTQAGTVRSEPEVRARPVERPRPQPQPVRPQAPPPRPVAAAQPPPAEQDRLSGHRAWEEQMRRRREGL